RPPPQPRGRPGAAPPPTGRSGGQPAARRLLGVLIEPPGVVCHRRGHACDPKWVNRHPGPSGISEEDSMELEGKVAIVVGGRRGIGRAYVLALARAGARVVAAARTLEPRPEVPAGELPVGKRHVLGLLPGSLSEVVAEVRTEGGQAIAVKCDIVRE